MDPNNIPCKVPIWAPGKEPLPPGITEAERPLLEQQKKWEKYMAMGMESCVTKAVMAGAGGAFLFFLQCKVLKVIPAFRQVSSSEEAFRSCLPRSRMRIPTYAPSRNKG